MEIIKNINWLDIIVLVLVVRGVYMGAKRGLTAELFNFFGIIISLILAIQWYSRVADVLILNFSLPIWLSKFLCFVVITQIIRITFKYSLALLLKILNIQFIPQLEKIGGGIIGLGRGVIAAGILILALSFIPNDYMKESIRAKSFTGNFLIRVTERIYISLIFWLPEQKRESAIFTN
jgi:uncharacterized membrane protein required for colicin V production